MNFSIAVRRLTAGTLLILFSLISARAAGDHVVPISELQARTVSASDGRQAALAKLDRFFSADDVRKALRTVKVDGTQIKHAVAVLSDEELARLSSRAAEIQADFAAGALSNQELTYIVIALVTAVVVLIIVKA